MKRDYALMPYPVEENEIVVGTDLCDGAGRLLPAAAGWSRQPLFRCNVTGHPFRKKKWDYWCVTSPEILFSATISSLDYAAVIFVYVLDLQTLQFHEESITVPFAAGLNMPNEVYAPVQYVGKRVTVSFDNDPAHEQTLIRVQWDAFGGSKLEAELSIQRPPGHETLNVVVPWSKTRFQFTSKQNSLPTQGRIVWGDRVYVLDSHDAFACLDYGRGVWRYKSSWNWASASGRVSDGRTLGITFGGQWTDGTGATENGLVVDGRLTKIHEDIRWNYNQQRYMDPWTLHTEKSDQVALTFTPLYERISKTDLLLIYSEVHQMIGHFNGVVITENGERIEVDHLLGWAEDHKARW